MKSWHNIVSFITMVFFTTLVVIIWAAIFQLPLFPGLLLGLVAGAIAGTWYCRFLHCAKKNKESNFRESINMKTTFLSLILFADLFASMLVWSFKELF